MGDTAWHWWTELRSDLREVAEHGPFPWRSEPSQRGPAWVVRDGRGAVVAAGLSEPLADLLAGLDGRADGLGDLIASGSNDIEDTEDREVLDRALGAIRYVLERAQREPDGLGRELSQLTEAWAKLTDAEAALTGEDLELVRERRRKPLPRRTG